MADLTYSDSEIKSHDLASSTQKDCSSYLTLEPILTESYCRKVLEIPEFVPLEKDLLHEQFIALSKKWHPDTNPESTKYSVITLCYDYLKDIIQKNAQRPENVISKIEPLPLGGLKKEAPKLPGINLKEEYEAQLNLLKYTVHYNWLELFERWRHNPVYTKQVGYYYEKKCTCQELCRFCRGAGVNLNQPCVSCSGNGFIHYCNTCKGGSTYAEKDYCEYSFDKDLAIPADKLYLNKGNELGLSKRGALLLNFKESGPIKRKTDKIFLYNVDIEPWQLTNSAIEIYINRNSTLLLNTSKIFKIPYVEDISSYFVSQLNKRTIKVYLKLNLKIKESS